MKRLIQWLFGFSAGLLDWVAQPIVKMIRACRIALGRVQPVLPYNNEYEEHVAHVHFGGHVTLMFAVASQVAVQAAVLWGWFKFGGSTGPVLAGAVVAIALSVAADRALWRELRNERPGHTGGFLAWSFWIGFPCLLVWILVAIRVAFQVTHLAVYAIAIPMIAWILLFFIQEDVGQRLGDVGMSLYAQGRRRVTWLAVWSTVVLGPLLMGWVVASVALVLRHDESATVRAWIDQHPPPRETSRDFVAHPRRDPRWEREGEPIRVAVALSGGGYRAAVTHAGVLAALADQGVPVDIVSSVSGGSIIGTAYALGVPPREFADRLKRQKPGLSDAVLNLRSVTQSTSEVYLDHLRTTYFGDITVNQLPDFPTLLLNVTNYHTHPSQAREVIRKEWVSLELEQSTPLTTAVTASGAFPGAFHPIELDWATRDDHGTTTGPHYLTDGGIVENLGTEGLRFYLSTMSWTEWYRTCPHVLIISDVSGYAADSEMILVNPSADAMLGRANAIQFEMLHRFLYAELTGVSDISPRIAESPVWLQAYTVPYPARFVPREAPVPGTSIEVLTS
jgi:hypothetical protein